MMSCTLTITATTRFRVTNSHPIRQFRRVRVPTRPAAHRTCTVTLWAGWQTRAREPTARMRKPTRSVFQATGLLRPTRAALAMTRFPFAGPHNYGFSVAGPEDPTSVTLPVALTIAGCISADRRCDLQQDNSLPLRPGERSLIRRPLRPATFILVRHCAGSPAARPLENAAGIVRLDGHGSVGDG